MTTDSESTTDERLARHYRRLLWAYSRGYRRARGSELIGTLIDGAAAGQSRPSIREASALVLGGLRQRLGIDDRRSYWTTLRMSVVLGFLVELAVFAAEITVQVVRNFSLYPALLPLVSLIALLAVLYLRRPVLALVVLAAQIAVIVMAAHLGEDMWDRGQVLLMTAPAPAIALLMRRRDPGPPMSWPLLIGVQMVLSVELMKHEWVFAVRGFSMPYSYFYLGLALVGVFFDARIALSLVWTMLLPVAVVGLVEPSRLFWNTTVVALVGAGLIAGAYRSRRDTAL